MITLYEKYGLTEQNKQPNHSQSVVQGKGTSILKNKTQMSVKSELAKSKETFVLQKMFTLVETNQ